MVVPRTAKHVSVDNSIKDGTVSYVDIVNGTIGLDKLKTKMITATGTVGQASISFGDFETVNGVYGMGYVDADNSTATQSIQAVYYDSENGVFKILFTAELDGTLVIKMPFLLL